MAMSREDQRAAAERILTKEPLTEEEVERLKYLTMEIEDYPPLSPEKQEILMKWLG